MTGDHVAYDDGVVRLLRGDFRELLPALPAADLIIADPPYGETSLAWDRWPDGWPELAARHAKSMWCFGSLRMWLRHRDDFARWKLAQDVIWEKHNGSSFHNDRFRRVHEQPVHWYQGKWRDIYHKAVTTPDVTRRTVRRKERPPHMGVIANSTYVSHDGGPRLARSVLRVRGTHGRAIHPTEKPVELLKMLIEYACPPGGRVISLFEGSGATLEAVRACGRTGVGIEVNPDYVVAAAARLAASQPAESCLAA